MSLQKHKLLGVSITVSPKDEILHWIKQSLSIFHSQFSIIQIVTPNPEQIVLAQKNEEFRRILNDANIALPDGAGVVWGMRRGQKTEDRGQKIEDGRRRAEDGERKIEGINPPSVFHIPYSVSRISGVDFMVDLCRMAAENHWKVLFLGGRDGAAEQALHVLQQTYKGLEGIAEDGPEVSGGTSVDPSIIDSLIQTIHRNNISMVFVGLGAPKQEYLMERLRKDIEKEENAERSEVRGRKKNEISRSSRLSSFPLGFSVICMSVGGSFDILAGKVKRAPLVIQNSGFEWLWRLTQEPWRWRRQLSLLTFFWFVLWEKNTQIE